MIWCMRFGNHAFGEIKWNLSVNFLYELVDLNIYCIVKVNINLTP